MKKYDRRSQSPSREEVAELATVIDPNPPQLPREVVVLLRRARRHCGTIIRTLTEGEFDCVAMRCDSFADEIDTLLQKYGYALPDPQYDYWEWANPSRA